MSNIDVTPKSDIFNSIADVFYASGNKYLGFNYQLLVAWLNENGVMSEYKNGFSLILNIDGNSELSTYLRLQLS